MVRLLSKKITLPGHAMVRLKGHLYLHLERERGHFNAVVLRVRRPRRGVRSRVLDLSKRLRFTGECAGDDRRLKKR